CNVRCGLAAGAALGALVAVLGGILIPVGKTVIRSTVEKEAVLEPGTTAYDNWVSADAPVYRQFWFFHVKNPEEVVKNGTTPVVEERGPYTYRTRYLPKENVTTATTPPSPSCCRWAPSLSRPCRWGRRTTPSPASTWWLL
ncbi:unnamed protein product, partial [Tetraodon nigroviridis]